VRVLFFENEDSFTWNVVEALPVRRDEVTLVPGREATTTRGLDLLERADVVVVGPGPRDPVRAGLAGLVLAAERAGRPVLGVCLGCQAIGLAHDARLVRVPPVHGKRSTITFAPSRLFPGFAGRVTVMRYHSLALASIGAPLRVVAETDDGIPMAIEHASLPVAGVQFHPDSYATPRGRELLAGFFEAAR
jgi:anthranilate synthase/aminodeoxychorismate synthase-like glutamine amidotransferase